MGDREDTALCLEGVADLVVAVGDSESATELLRAAEGLRGSVVPAFSAANLDYLRYDAIRDSLRATLGEKRFDAALEKGRMLSSDHTMALARQHTATQSES